MDTASTAALAILPCSSARQRLFVNQSAAGRADDDGPPAHPGEFDLAEQAARLRRQRAGQG